MDKTQRLKRIFFQVLIACLLGATAIAVIAVLTGIFNDTLGRSLGTIVVVALHALLSFSYVTKTEKQDQKDGGRSIELFSNAVFGLIVASFITATFAIWQLIGGELTFKLYMFYGVLLFATLHADVLYRIRHFERKIDTVVTVNYVFMATVVTLLTIAIFSNNSSDLGEAFYRLLAASGIVDAAMTITAIIMHKMYLQVHPEVMVKIPASKNFWQNPLVVLILVYLLFQVLGSIFALAVRGF